MQPKYRSERPQYGRNRSHNGVDSDNFNKSYSKIYNPPACKTDILMEAGRLAAEYLVAKGVMPASMLPGSSLPDGGLPELRGRESASQVSYSEGRTSALPQLGNSGADAGYGRRKFSDDYSRSGSRKNNRGRRKMGYYNDRGYGLNWGRDRSRNGSWNERSRGYSDIMEDDDDFAPGYRNRERRGGYDEVGSSISRVAGDEQHSKSLVGESASDLDDTGSKASSNNARKETRPELDEELNKELDDVRVSTIECSEVKSARNEEFEMKTSADEDMDVKLGEIKDVSGGNHGNNLLSLCGFAKVPTRPRSSLAHKDVSVGQGPELDTSGKVEAPSRQDYEMEIDKVSAHGPTQDSHTMLVDNSKAEVPVGFSALITECTKEMLQSEGEVHKRPLCLGSSSMTVGETKKNDFLQDVVQKVESETKTKLPPVALSQGNESYELDSQRMKQSSLEVIMSIPDREMVDSVSEIKPVAFTSVLKDEDESFERVGEEKQNQPASFDLNLMDAPDMSEIPDCPVRESCQTSAPPPEGDNKIFPIVVVEDETPAEENIGDSSKHRNEVMYPTLVNVLNHNVHPDDLPGIQDNSYGLADFLSCSPSVQADFNNLQEGMVLHAAEGFAGVDDSIYGSLGDIGFMEVWGDQPSHEYEKFF